MYLERVCVISIYTYTSKNIGKGNYIMHENKTQLSTNEGKYLITICIMHYSQQPFYTVKKMQNAEKYMWVALLIKCNKTGEMLQEKHNSERGMPMARLNKNVLPGCSELCLTWGSATVTLNWAQREPSAGLLNWTKANAFTMELFSSILMNSFKQQVKVEVQF